MKFFFHWLRKYSELCRYLVTAVGLNVPLIFLIIMQDMKNVEWSELTFVYLLSIIIGYYGLPLLLLNLIISPLSFVHRKLAIFCSGMVNAIFVFYLLIDSFAFDIAKFHIDFFWLKWILNDYEGLGLPANTLYFGLIALLLIIALEIGVFALARRICKLRYVSLAFTLLIVLCFGISQTIHIFAYERNDIRITKLTPYFPFYIAITSHSSAVKYGKFFPFNETEPMIASKENQYGLLNYPLSEMKYSLQPGTTPPNIVIIFFESWRFDSMNKMVTPNIFALSQKSSVFLNHFSSGNQTTCGIFGLFYGLHPTYWSTVKANNSQIDNPVFIDALKNNQYSFGIYAKSKFKRHKIEDTIFRGITVHESFAGNSDLEEDVDMTRQVISFIREQSSSGRPFMALAFYKSNHLPYLYPESHKIFLPAKDLNMAFTSPDTDPQCYLNDYWNSTHYADSLAGEIVRVLDSLGEMKNTVIVITTEHGEEFNDNRANYWGHGTNYTQYQTRVPLILYLPGRKPQQVSYPTSHIDVPPTLLINFFGCTTDIQDYSNGRNLLTTDTIPRPFIIGSYVNHAFIIDDNVYEIYPIYTKKYKLNDINKEASRPNPDLLKIAKEEISRFFGDTHSEKLSKPEDN